MTATLEDSNAALRKAVETRLSTGTYDEYVEITDTDTRTITSRTDTESMPECAAAEVSEHAPRGLSAAEVIERFAVPEPRRFYGSTEDSQTRSDTYAEWVPAFRGDSLLRDKAAPGSREWLAALERLRALHIEKTAQYGGADDAFENVTASAKCGVEPWRRALCDLSDCVVRMQKYAQGQPVDPTNALLDAANWALICLIKMEEAKK